MRLSPTGPGATGVAGLKEAAAPGGLPEGARRCAALGGGVAALAAMVIACSVVIACFGAIHVDDSYITYRYARNLARREGLVFNPGERVEGYTNLLHVLVLTPAFWFGVDGAAVHALSVALGILASFGVIALVMWRLWRSHGRPAAMIGAVLLALCPTVW